MRGTAEHPPLYDAILRRHGAIVEYITDAQEQALREIIDAVKSGLADVPVSDRLSVLVTANLATPKHRVLLACTELDALPLQGHDPTRTFSSGRALAAECVETYRKLHSAASQRH
jgi:aspartate/glutamate racemase